MARFYKGAAIGSHWYRNDARISGIQSMNIGAMPDVGFIRSHILRNSYNTPFISLTRSYAIALDYALFTSHNGQIPSEGNPAYVYEIEIDDDIVNNGLRIYDPVVEIAKNVPPPQQSVSYQHDGGPKFLIGVSQPVLFPNFLNESRLTPSGPGLASPILTDDLIVMVRALRDAEVLVAGSIPRNCMIERYDVIPP